MTNQSHSPSTRSLLLGIWVHLSRRRRIQLGLLFVVMLASSGAELVSLGAVLPFLGVLSEPELLWQHQLVKDLSIRLGLNSASQLLLPATLGFVAAVVLTALIRMSNLWLNGRLAAAVGSDLSCEAYKRTLYQPYSVHVQRNSAVVITNITTEIAKTVAGLSALLQVFTSSLVALGLLTGLLLIDAPVAAGAAALFGSAYGLLAITSRRELRSNGKKIVEASRKQLKALQEGLGAIRDVLLDGLQPTYLQIYRQADRPQRQLQAKNFFLGSFPRYALEALGLVAIATLGGLLVFQRGSGVAVIPLLGALALGAQRLLPALQQVYSGWSALNSHNAAMQAVLVMLSQPLPPIFHVVEPLRLSHSIHLESIDFSYLQDQPKVLDGLNLQIRHGEVIGLIGTTGSGKSTMVDVLMGLLEPTTGRVLVDGQDLHDPQNPELLLAWRECIAHVPQNFYLADSSIAENIAFGVPIQNIDFALVKKAAAQAQIAEFIENSPDGYDSFVGERGIRLSGGQRQRIGIARALYKQASVIIFDEATSALDAATEGAVMQAVEELSRNHTIIIIAHRLSTVQRCDRVLHLERGIIIADGPPSLILKPSKRWTV